MQLLIVVLFALHAMPGVFWVGSTFTLARFRGEGAAGLFRSQMGAAAVSFLAGIGLWATLYRGAQGIFEHTLAVGALCAVAAAGVQGALRRSPALAHRIAAGLLAVSVLCMVTGRYIG